LSPRKRCAAPVTRRAQLAGNESVTNPTLERSMTTISYEDFAKLDIRVGRIVQVEDFPQARKPAWKLRIDFRELGVASSNAQLTLHYGKEDLLGKLVLAVVNFPPRQIANFFSEVLTLGIDAGPGDVVLVHPDRDVQLGAKLC